MGNNDHSLSRRDRNFIIFTEASGVVKPGEGTFHHPTPGKFLPLVRLDFLWNINIKAKLFFHIRDKRPPIPCICAEFLDRRISLIRLLGGRYSAFCIMNVGSMNGNRQQTTQHIHYDVPLSAFRFFPPSIPACSTCSSASPYTVVLFLPSAYLLSRSGTSFVLFLP